MPVEPGWKIVTLGEGGTPLLPAPHLSDRVGLRGVPQGRRGEPDGVVQGPRDDDGGHGRAGPRPAGRDLRVDRQHVGLRGRLRRPGGHDLRGARPAGQDRARQARAGRRARGADPADRRQLRRLPGARPQDRAGLPGRRAGQLGQPHPDRGSGERGLRDLRRARPRTGRALPARRQRRQHHRLLGGLPRVRDGRRDRRPAADVRFPGRRRGAAGARRAGAPPRDDRDRDPDRGSRVVDAGGHGA